METTINFVLFQYERIWNKVVYANHLFGIVMLIADGALFSMTTIIVYTILHDNQTSIAQLLEYFMFFVIFVVRLVSSVLFKDQLQQSAKRLQSTLAQLLCSNWNWLSKNERNAMANAINHIEAMCVCVAPLDLYLVNRKTLLSMLSLTVSFVIILLQSK